jgi:ABC-2 type transport system ATP-binding protein
MLEIKDVRQSFRAGFWLNRVEVLKGISFNVESGSIFGFLGPNGAGKTTLIHLIVGMKHPTVGSIRLDGMDTFERKARMKIGYLPERPYFHDFLTGEELLVYFGRLSGLRKSDVLSRVDKVLGDVGMRHARKLELRKYSKGMLQRIGIAQAILHDPEFLVLDEPMSGLDPIGRKEIRELIIQLSKQGRTIFFSTHVIPDVEAICDHVGIIRKGEIIESGKITDYLKNETPSIEIEFTGVDPTRVLPSHLQALFRQIPEGIQIEIPSTENIDGIVKTILDQNGKIISLNPVRPSLEERFQ